MRKETFRRTLSLATALAVLGGLWLTRSYRYLLFHSIAEIFSIAVAAAIFMLVWNLRHQMDSDYLLLLGIGYATAGIIDLIHTLAYKGMGVFVGYDANLPTQLWIAARYVQALSLITAPSSWTNGSGHG